VDKREEHERKERDGRDRKKHPPHIPKRISGYSPGNANWALALDSGYSWRQNKTL